MKASSPVRSYDQQARVGRLLNRAKSRLEGAMDRELTPYDLTSAQFVVMSILASGSAGSSAELCKEIVYDPGAMTRMLDRLEQKNLVRRVYSRGEDRRKVKLELTEQGLALFPKVKVSSGALLERVLGGLSADELDQLESLLTHIVRCLDA